MGLNRLDDPDAVWDPPAPGRYCLRVCYCGGCPQYVPLPPLSEARRPVPRRAHRPRRRKPPPKPAWDPAQGWDPEWGPAAPGGER